MAMENENNIKFSNFPLLYYLVRNACDDLGIPVSNFVLDFSKLENEKMFINKQAFTLKEAIYNSARSAGRKINENEMGAVLSSLIGIMEMAYGFYDNAESEENINVNFDQFVGAFTLSRNVITPLCEIELINFPVCIKNNMSIPYYASEKEKFINIQISNRGTMDCIAIALLCNENKIDEKVIFSKIISSRIGRRMLVSSLKEIYGSNENDINGFLIMAHSFADINNLDAFSKFKNEINKFSSFTAPSFWIFGLIEKMLAPVRGVRDNISEKWAPISAEIWDRIDERRKKMGLPHAPMELMLRVQAEPFSQENDNSVLQSKLEESRLWKIKTK